MAKECAIARELFEEVSRRESLRSLAFNDGVFRARRDSLFIRMPTLIAIPLTTAEMRVLVRVDVDPYVLAVVYEDKALIAKKTLLLDFLELVRQHGGFHQVSIFQGCDNYRWFWVFDRSSGAWQVE